jgi:cytoskeletal protein CcmA (bactofilin family)
VVFRREKQADSLNRQMSALRQRLGDGADANQGQVNDDLPEYGEDDYGDDAYGSAQPMNAADANSYSFGDYAVQGPDDELPDEDEQGLLIPEMPAVDSQISVIATDTKWKGTLESDGSLHVYGVVDGALTAHDDIWVAEGATVDAVLTARRIVIAGTISGTVTASERFEALPQGRINADVSAPAFVVHDGAKINGQLKMAQPEGSSSTTASSYERASSLSVIQRRARTGN